MPGLHLELEGAVEAVPEAVEDRGHHLDHDTTGLADEVVVGVVGEVVDAGAVPEVDVVDDAEALELVEEAVHGRLVHIGLACLHDRRQLLGRRVPVVLDQGLEDRPAGARDAPPVLPQDVEHRFEPGNGLGFCSERPMSHLAASLQPM